jgi:HSP20 family molecular chaperone IbpA
MGFISRDAFTRADTWIGNRSSTSHRHAMPEDIGSEITSSGISLLETAAGIEIRAEIPGDDNDRVEVALGDNEITIRCRRDLSRRAFVQHSRDRQAERVTESVYDAVAQSIRLPFAVSQQATVVSFVDGKLRILAPKCGVRAPGATRIRYGDTAH